MADLLHFSSSVECKAPGMVNRITMIVCMYVMRNFKKVLQALHDAPPLRLHQAK